MKKGRHGTKKTPSRKARQREALRGTDQRSNRQQEQVFKFKRPPGKKR